MVLNYRELKEWRFPDQIQQYDEKDVILYALGVGYGFDPLDAGQLRYVYEKNLCVAPTMPVVFCHPGQWVTEPSFGLTWARIVHGEQAIRLHRPLCTNATIFAKTKNVAVSDKGLGKAAIIRQERTLFDQVSGDLLATTNSTYLALADGGFAASSGGADEAPAPPPPTPDRSPDRVCDLAIPPQAALIYRLSGDINPLHVDPSVAEKAGFPRPILQGLCSFGLAGHALLRTWCAYDSLSFQAMSVRFSAPVYPGETICTEMWREGNTVSFQARSLERGLLVLSNGVAEIA
jgi:acyl dehydratase